jgi:hypothetical protein
MQYGFICHCDACVNSEKYAGMTELSLLGGMLLFHRPTPKKYEEAVKELKMNIEKIGDNAISATTLALMDRNCYLISLLSSMETFPQNV